MAKPSLLRFVMPAGRSQVLVTTKRPAFAPVCAMSSVAVRPSHVSSQTAHTWVLSGSYSISMIFGNPLRMVATRLKAPVRRSSAYAMIFASCSTPTKNRPAPWSA
jgi:hypothetical protein